MPSHFTAAPRMPQMPPLCSPSAPALLSAASFHSLPWRTVQWQGTFHLVYVRGISCCIGGIVGGGSHCLLQWLVDQLPSPHIIGCLLVILCVTLCWKLSRARSILGVSTHVSAPISNTACNTALKNVPTPSDPPPPGSRSATTSPNAYSP